MNIFENYLIKINKLILKNKNSLELYNLDNLKNGDGVFIFVQENSQKTKAQKEIFKNTDNACIIDCYELNKASKIKILNEFLKKKKIKILEDVYWFLVDKLDNRYAFLENSLNKILEIDIHNITIENIRKLISQEGSTKENLFFQMFRKNDDIVKIYKDKIISKNFLLSIEVFKTSSIPCIPKNLKPNHSLIISAGLEPCIPSSPLFKTFLSEET